MPEAELAGIATAKFPDAPENEVSTIGKKLAKAFAPTETENKVGVFATALYGIVNEFELVYTIDIVPNVIVGKAFTAPVTAIVFVTAFVELIEILPAGEPVLAAVNRA